ncbi:MAG TPA: ParB/RepB/Spo0J family partition protein [Candidatus Eubacterium faecale]|uniref:ParB/RepB/Spo0J family partition protein n=1 Tax=Candidatus Eubacterium faecale TaxID=2838568 RepID=A0A9D2S962_9FIRM|nr:ParB/RepB/Spo0J family partition protein [Candidatus Eubacterium faecale]
MANPLPNLSRDSLDDLFTTQEQRDDEKLERVNVLQIDEIDNFTDHPYKVRDDAKMDELVDSIENYGIMVPCIVRPKDNGRYEMIAGHRRKHAALRAGITQLPCIVRKLSDDEATILMVDSNSQREQLLPSEKAFAYKMRLDAMKRQAGRPVKKNGAPVEHHFSGMKSRDILSEQVGESKEQVRRYIRLTDLIPELLECVDNSVEKPEDKDALRMALRPAVELSYLTPENQRVVLEFMKSSLTTPSHAQTILLRKMQDDHSFTPQAVFELLQQEKPNQKERVSLSIDKFNRYFPPNTSAKDIEKGIFRALDFYMEAKMRSKGEKEIDRSK